MQGMSELIGGFLFGESSEALSRRPPTVTRITNYVGLKGSKNVPK